jgi:predicted dehydrogenase
LIIRLLVCPTIDIIIRAQIREEVLVPIRTVVVGLGPMGQLHRLAAAANEDFVIVGGSDPEIARSEGLPRDAIFARDYHELLRRTAPDLVVIATPPALHAPIVRAAHGAGSHVLCEKPLTTDSGGAEALAAAVDTNPLISAIKLQLRFSLARQEMRRLVRDGFVGRLIGLRAVLASPGYHDVAPAWYRDLGLGGGVLMELGTHVLDQMIWLGGPIDWASGVRTTATVGPDGVKPAPGEDHVAATVRFAAGHVGELTVSTIARSDPPRSLEVVGERGTLRLVGETRLDWEEAGRPATQVPVPAETFRSLTGDPQDSYTQPLQRLYVHLAEAILRNGSFQPMATLSDGAAVQAVIDRIRRTYTEADPR